MRTNIPVMILAGGLGTRLREETDFRPKPMVPIGGKPILWHIMKHYSHYGFYRFIICLGYKGEMIKDYFLNYRVHGIDLTVNLRSGKTTEHQINNEDWEITLVDTGQNCLTGGRVARAAKYVDTDRFMLTYGDGVSDVNINKLLNFHLSNNKIATLTGVKTVSRFGNLELNENQIIAFKEKEEIPKHYINGGFFVFEREFLKYLSKDSSCVLEQLPLKTASSDGQLMMYRHDGFWRCMDTFREHQELEALWKKNAPWKVWNDMECKDIYRPIHRSQEL